MWCYRRLFHYLSAFGNSQANDLVTELLPITVISCVVCTMRENRFLLFLNHLRLPYSIPKSFALLLNIHVARHSYATRCINMGIRLEVVAKLLGHSSTRLTQHYAKLLEKNIINEVQEAFDNSIFSSRG